MQLGLLGAQVLFLVGAAIVAVAPASSRHSKLLGTIFFLVVLVALVAVACDRPLRGAPYKDEAARRLLD